MPPLEKFPIDCVIFGGGAAGLWTLDAVRRAGFDALLFEAFELGHGQTVASQGIIHGGLKYSLRGMVSPSARAIRSMPERWRTAMTTADREGGDPDLRGARMRSEACLMWQTRDLSSRLALFGARRGLASGPEKVAASDVPAVLNRVPGQVLSVAEPVIDPEDFVRVLAERHRDRILKVDVENRPPVFADGVVTVTSPALTAGQRSLTLAPGRIFFMAGKGNAELRRQAGLSAHAMQTRPLHMLVASGQLPVLNGHCVDGMKTRLTITSCVSRLHPGATVWQIGGQIAEDGVSMDRAELIRRGIAEVTDCIPGIDLNDVQWGSYRVDRAEAATGGSRPEDATIMRDAVFRTAWPTKLALAPKLADQCIDELRDTLTPRGDSESSLNDHLRDWPRPAVAAPPWEHASTWNTVASAAQTST